MPFNMSPYLVIPFALLNRLWITLGFCMGLDIASPALVASWNLAMTSFFVHLIFAIYASSS